MKDFKLYRIVLNILFFIFYILILSLIFTFLFPLIQITLGLTTWNINDTRFDIIQIVIIFIVLIFSSIYRKYFYLPITLDKKIENNNKSYTKRVKEKKKINLEESNDDLLELDIKIGKEIK